MAGYLIQFNKKTQQRRVEIFEGPSGHKEAMRRRLDLEKEGLGEEWEIVSLNADSIDSVMRSHSRYFQGSDVPPAGHQSNAPGENAG